MILEKRLNGVWWFYDEFYTGGFTPYPFGCIIDKTANTFVITKENRPSYPKEPLPVAEVQIRVLPSTSLETYSTAELLENRLLELEFPPLVNQNSQIYDIYEANIMQELTNNPIIVGETIGFDGNITLLRDNIGIYSLNSDGLFKENKTFVNFSSSISETNVNLKRLTLFSKTSNKLTFVTTNDSSKQDGIWDLPITISIKVKK